MTNQTYNIYLGSKFCGTVDAPDAAHADAFALAAFGPQAHTECQTARHRRQAMGYGGPTLGAGTSEGRTEGMSYLDKDNL